VINFKELLYTDLYIDKHGNEYEIKKAAVETIDKKN
jgi:hypothetical protein